MSLSIIIATVLTLAMPPQKTLRPLKETDLQYIQSLENRAIYYKAYNTNKNFKYKKKYYTAGTFALGANIFASGILLNKQSLDIRNYRNLTMPNLRTHFDDYLQFSPLTAAFILKTCGLKGHSNWTEFITASAFSAGIVVAFTQSIKYSTCIMRPDGSSANSFPSGHTSFAFMGAAVLDKEFGKQYPLISVLGYSAATLTGIGRIMNNRHWFSDVVSGAGLGIMSTQLAYGITDAIFKKRKSLKKEIRRSGNFFTFSNSFFLNFFCGGNIPLSNNYLSGTYYGLETGYFFSPYFGVGSTCGIDNLVKTDTKKQCLYYSDLAFYARVPISAGKFELGCKLGGTLSVYLINLIIIPFPMLGLGICSEVSFTTWMTKNIGLKMFCNFRSIYPEPYKDANLWITNYGTCLALKF